MKAVRVAARVAFLGSDGILLHGVRILLLFALEIISTNGSMRFTL